MSVNVVIRQSSSVATAVAGSFYTECTNKTIKNFQEEEKVSSKLAVCGSR